MSPPRAETNVSDVRLADAFDIAAARFGPTGVLLSLIDDAGVVLLHDERFDPARRSTLLAALNGQAQQGAPAEGVALRPLAAGRTLALSADPARFSPDLLGSLADAALATLQDHLDTRDANTRLEGITEQLADNYEELTLLYQVSTSMRINRSPEDHFRTVCAEAAATLGARVVGAALRPGRSRPNSLVVHGDLDLDPARLMRFIDEATEILCDRAFSDNGLPPPGPLVVNDLASDPSLGFLAPGISSLLAAPLIRDDQLLGFLFAADKDAPPQFGSSRGTGFDSVDTKLLVSVAAASAVYVENAILFEDMHGLMMGLLHSLTAAVDAKDSYTCGHSERVALLSRLLAQQAGFTDRDADRVYIAGLLHDVGKIGVPEGVLQKCGKLTPAEFDAMKTHPAIGARILADVKQVQDVIPGVLHHHERFDGRGYPHNLAGNDIPMLGRIICLADSFDAMTTNRTYRRGMPLQQALDEISRCAGTQFDPELAQLFVSLGAERIDQALENHRAHARLSASPLTLRQARAA